MVLGLMPLLYSSGADAAARSSIGPLFVVPMFHTCIAPPDRPPAEVPAAPDAEPHHA